VAERIGHFVTAYSGDLKDESLDGERVVVGGVVTGSRTVVTKAKATMAVVTLEDLQGAIEVVVFPRLYEQTTGTWSDGVILLVAGRIDHRGEEVSLLADAAWNGTRSRRAARRRFASESRRGRAWVRAGRGRSGGSHANGANGVNGANGRRAGNGYGRTEGNGFGRAEGNGYGPAEGNGPGSSPDREASERAGLPTPAMPPVAAPRVVGTDRLRRRCAGPRSAATAGGGTPAGDRIRRRADPAGRGGPAGRLHVRFGVGIGPDVLQPAMATVRDILRGHPAGRG